MPFLHTLTVRLEGNTLEQNDLEPLTAWQDAAFLHTSTFYLRGAFLGEVCGPMLDALAQAPMLNTLELSLKYVSS